MIWSWTLYRYLALQFLLGVVMVYGGFLTLAFAIDIVDLLNRTAGRGVDTGTVIVVSGGNVDAAQFAKVIGGFD